LIVGEKGGQDRTERDKKILKKLEKSRPYKGKRERKKREKD